MESLDEPDAPPPDFRYPDSDHMLGDTSVLRNALLFTTAQRAYVADSLLHLPLDQMPENVMAFVVLEAFGAEMTSMEDTLGWLFALRDWQPGTAAHCLMANLDTIQVGRGEYDETHTMEFLSSMDEPKLREVLHMPSDEALRQAGLSEELIAKVDHSLPYKLDGLRRIVDRRAEANRTRVKAFAKLKHALLAFPVRETDSRVVVQLIKGKGYRQGEIYLDTLTLVVSTANIQDMAGNALAMQTMLWDMLAMILWIRFGEQHDAPPWASHSMEHTGWRNE